MRRRGREGRGGEERREKGDKWEKQVDSNVEHREESA